jgi:hypothetical protein
VLALLATAALGLGLLWGFSGHAGLPPLPWTDVHAAWGLLGWGVGLVASVGTVVLPMFQGARLVPGRALYAGLAGIAVVLAVGTLQAWIAGSTRALGWGGAVCVGVLGVSGLWLQWRARHTRNAWLVRAWRAGLSALVAGAVALAIGGQPVWVGVLLLAIGFPWLVAGMQLEIVAFLGWIELHRRCGRGVRLPPVQALLTETEKGSVFVAFAIAALALLVATAWPPAARVAGVALLASHALLGWRLHGVRHRVRAFLTDRTCEPVEVIHAG